MTCEEVRLRLTLLRGRDADPGRIAAATEHASTCAACRAWRDADARLTEAIASLGAPVPGPALREGVMARVRAMEVPGAARPAEPPSWWRQPLFVLEGLAAAAALAFLLGPGGATMVEDGTAEIASVVAAADLDLAVPPFSYVAGEAWAVLATDSLAGAPWLLVVTAAALVGNLAMFARGGGARLRGLAPFLVAAAVLTATTTVGAHGQPDDALWVAVRETVDAVKLLAFLVVFALAALGAVAIGIAARAFAPALAARADRVLADRTGLYQFLVGLFNVIILTLLVVALGRFGGPGRLVAVLVLVAMGLTAALGLAARLPALGRALLAGSRRARTDLAFALAGGAALVAAMLCPFAGQMFWLLLLVQCFGTGLLAALRRGPAGRSDEAATVSEPELDWNVGGEPRERG